MKDIRLDHVVIAVSDWERSVDFYRAVVGAEVIDRGGGRVCFRIGETQLTVRGPGFYPKTNVARLPVRPETVPVAGVVHLWQPVALSEGS